MAFAVGDGLYDMYVEIVSRKETAETLQRDLIIEEEPSDRLSSNVYESGSSGGRWRAPARRRAAARAGGRRKRSDVKNPLI
ncbi:hypothetical protein EVAR_85410_1 [Eumeta japonica]|uniref:Uncharacterized protein n=1 Tax=Eumeta variegata TaxID=151549 RepID=A0A4C1WLL8_EUMVA|nr:hypothetical protein EVAR_85410_1 [Eumeta japonica]